MIARGRIVTCLFLLDALVLQRSVYADAVAAPDFSTPRAAAKSFFNAIEAGDLATVRLAMLAEDDPQKRLVEAFTGVIAASKKIAAAARDKFGAGGDMMQMSAIPKEEAAKIDKAEEKIDGAQATLVISGRPLPMKFKKASDGAWKLVVTDFAGATPANIGPQIDLLKQMAKLMDETAADISAGKFASPDQAQAAFEQKFNAAMIESVKPATAPATRP